MAVGAYPRTGDMDYDRRTRGRQISPPGKAPAAGQSGAAQAAVDSREGAGLQGPIPAPDAVGDDARIGP